MTRMGVFSDSHGDSRSLLALLGQMGRLSAVFFLGDIARDSDLLEAHLSSWAIPPVFCAVRGNNDLASLLPDEILTELDGVRVYLTHGHLCRVRGGTAELVRRAKERGAQIALYGHTHEPYCAVEQGILVVNPGAAHPFGNRRARACVIEIENGRFRVQDIVY